MTNHFVALCLDCTGGKIEFDFDQNEISLKDSVVIIRNTVFRKACKYDYNGTELFMYMENDQFSRYQKINPHVLPYPMDNDIIYGNIIFILTNSNFDGNDYDIFFDTNMFASSPLSSQINSYFRSNAIRHIEKINTCMRNRSDS